MMEHRNVTDIASAARDVEQAAEWSALLENREAARSGIRVADARRIVARRVGTMPGTLENLRGGRLKSIATHVFSRLRGAVIQELQLEAQRLEHEAAILLQTGTDPRSDEVAAVVADLARIRKVLNPEVGPRNDGDAK
jgi:hypothetical protein